MDGKSCLSIEKPGTWKDKCECEEWKVGMEKINAPIFLQQGRGGFVYGPNHFVQMKFCPWCGESLKLVEDHN